MNRYLKNKYSKMMYGRNKFNYNTTIETFKCLNDYITIGYISCYDKVTNEYIRDEKIAKINERSVFNIYREKHGLLYPAHIKMLRNKYKLSHQDLASIIGCDKKYIKRYDRGSIISNEHNSKLKAIINIVESKKDFLSCLINQHNPYMNNEF